MSADCSCKELADRHGISTRTIYHWIDQGLVPGVPYQGRQTRYGREPQARVAAIRKLRKESVPFPKIAAMLAKMTLAQIEALTGIAPPQAPAPPPAPPPVAPPAPPPVAVGPVVLERWGRVALLPGLELTLREDASPVVKRVAAEIAERYRAT